MNLIEIQDKLKRVPLPMLDAASKGQVPSIPPYLAATELAERQRVMASQQQAQQAAQAPQQTTTDTIKQGLSSLLQQQMNQQKNMQQMAQQMGQTPAPGAQIPGPVRAARGGLMSMVRMAEGGAAYGPAWGKLENALKRGLEAQRRAFTYSSDVEEERAQAAKREAEAEERRLAGRYPAPPELRMSKMPSGAVEDLVARALRGSQEHQAALQQYLRDNPDEQATVAGIASRANQELQRPAPVPTPAPTPAPMDRGLGGLTADAVAQAEQAPPAAAGVPSTLTGEYQKNFAASRAGIGQNAPDETAGQADIQAMREEAARLADARRKLFEAQQQGGYSGWLDTLSRSVLANQGASSGQRALAALTDLGRYNEQQRMAQPEFEYGETEADVGTSAKAREAAAKLREQMRAYKEGAATKLADLDRPMAQEEMSQTGQNARERYSRETQLMLEQLREKGRMATQRAADNRASTAERTAARQEINGIINSLKAGLAKPGDIITKEQKAQQQQVLDEIAYWRAELAKLGGYTPPTAAAAPGVDTTGFTVKRN